MRRSLAIRLSASTAMVVAATLLVVVALTAHIARRHLGAALDERLQDAAEQFRAGPAGRITSGGELAADAPRWLAEQVPSGDEVIAVHTADGQVFITTGGLDLRAVPGSLQALTAGSTRWWDLSSPRGPVRALSTPLELDGRQIGTLVVAASRIPVEAQLAALLVAVGWASVLGLIFAAALAFAAVRRTLRPLLLMSSQVDAVQATGDLSRRVRCAGPPDEVGRLADGFNRLLHRLEDAFRSQRRFVSDASHELRTPLTVARGQVELALADPAAAPVAQPLAGALVELDRVGRIVEELLLLARLDEGLPLAAEPVEVELVCEEALLRGLRLAPRRGWVEAEPGLCARADPDRLLQVLSNLVVNAVQHAGEDAQLVLRARRLYEQVVIEVADTGRGIPAEHLPYVFDRFYRGDAVRRTSGAGLGLAIAASLSVAMGGRIEVRSAPAEGTTFTVTLPAVPAVAALPPAGANPDTVPA